MATVTEELVVAGRKLTEETLRQLQALEVDRPGAVHSLILYFRDKFSDDQLDFLLNAERSVQNRHLRCGMAVDHSDQMQQGVRGFLWTDPQVHSSFRKCPDFQYEPHRHIQWQSMTNTLVVPGNLDLADRLRKQDNVLAVDVDFPVYLAPGVERADWTEVMALGRSGSPARHVDGYTWGWDLLDVRRAHRQGWLGEGITVGIADTGVYANHADAILKVKDFRKAMPSGHLEEGNSFDPDGHGTHVAGTVAGENNRCDPETVSPVRLGGAPRADLKVVAFLEHREGHTAPVGTFSSLIKTLDWFAEDRQGVDVVNLSVGFRGASHPRIQTLDLLFRALTRLGLLCVASAGNRAKDPLYPAALNSVISCGALTPQRRVWDSSANSPDFVLPGVSVYSCVPHGMEKFQGQNYAWMSGTSMAAAHMSGWLALCMEARRGVPLRDLVDRCRRTATRGNQHHRRFGWGVPQLFEVVPEGG